MRRRSSTGGEPVRARRHKSVTLLKRRNAPKVTRSRPSSVGGKDKKIALLTRERDEALEQQTATAEVLQVISSSPGDLKPVFETMLAKAVRICDARFGNIFRWDGDALHLLAAHNVPIAFDDVRRRLPLRPSPGNTPLGRMVATKTVVHVTDLAGEKSYIERAPSVVAAVELGGIRTFLAVPMLKEGELIGAFTLNRPEVRPFTEKQIALVTNFAAQAVIAIENTRLLSELRESLQEQTATSEVLQVISSSSGNVQPVFSTVLENAVRICEAKFGVLYLYEGGGFRSVAARDVPPAFAEALGKEQFPPAPGGVLDAVMKTGRTVHVSDLAAMQGYLERHHRMVASVELGGVRTVVAVPMLRGDELVGVIGIYRQEVRPFTEKQIALLTNFAAQAVIAIENARLLNELRERTSQLEMQSQEVVKLNQQLEQRVANQVGEIERMSRLRRFLPPQVADLIVASGGRSSWRAIGVRSRLSSATCAASPASLKAPTRKTLWLCCVSITWRLARSLSGIAARSNDMRATGSWWSSMIPFRSIAQPFRLCRWHWKCGRQSVH
jgi:GAF domain-containing protein